MSLKQKEEITIWAFKDGKKGHEKQVEALISELSLYKKINLHEFEVWESHALTRLNNWCWKSNT